MENLNSNIGCKTIGRMFLSNYSHNFSDNICLSDPISHRLSIILILE